MTVKDFKKQLNTIPDDAEVMYYDFGEQDYLPLSNDDYVYISKINTIKIG